MKTSVWGMTRFLWSNFLANVQGALEYRVSFFAQVIAMVVTDASWLLFWVAFFDQFPIGNEWGRAEVVLVWAVAATSFGLATTVCGNILALAGMIVRGELDFYLALPKPVLPHMLVSKMNLAAPGDVIFGLVVFGLFGHPTPTDWALFALLTCSSTVLLVSFCVLAHSLAFWLGNSEGLSVQLTQAIVHFSLYPTSVFRGAVKVALFTIIPAGFVSYYPVRLLRSFDGPLLAGVLCFTVLFTAASIAVFQAGLRRYTSGNLIAMRH